jgi:DNA-binding MarR family transcriptional regulator
MPEPIDLNCACASIRRAARLVSQLYNHEIGNGVETSQYSLLTALSRRPGATQAPIGRALGLDKTTVSRNMRVLLKNGWVEPAPSPGLNEDRRERGYRLTPLGKQVLADAKPGWERAQRKLRAAIKPEEWDAVLKVFNQVAAAALDAQHPTP